MIFVFIGILMTIVAFIVMVLNDIDHKLLCLFLLLICLLGFVKMVPTGNTGIVSVFGRVEDATLDAGIHFLAPWKSVICMDNRTQKATIEMSCFSSDLQEVNVKYALNYQINKSNASEIYKKIGENYFDAIISPRAQESVKTVIAVYTAENLMAKRAILSETIEKDLITSLEAWNIQVTGTSIEDIDFTDAFTKAVERKQVAEQNKLRAKIKQEQAVAAEEAAAKRKVISSQAEADAAIVAAKADAEVAKIAADSAEYQGQKDAAIMSNLGTMLQKYPELIQYYYVTGWDGKLPETMLDKDSSLLMQVQ